MPIVKAIGWKLLTAVVLLGPAAAAGYRAWQAGLESLTYDECEYVQFALETHDRLRERGLLTWPAIIADEQHYAKPPLLVNMLTGWQLLLGRSRIMAAIVAQAVVVTLALAAIPYMLFRRLWGEAAGLLAALALGSMPALACFASEVYPETLVVVFFNAVLAVLYWPGWRWSPWRAGLLGIGLGLGLHAKATFPALVAGPLLVWLLAGGVDHQPRLARRLGFLGLSGLLGAAVAALWYVANWAEALAYVRSAHSFVTHYALDAGGHPASRGAVVAAWVKGTLLEGFGLAVCALLLTATLTALGSTRRPAPADRRPPTALVVGLLLAGLPMMCGAVTSPNVSRRLLLPALVAMVMAAALYAAAAAGSKRVGRLRAATVALLALQWLSLRLAVLEDRIWPPGLAAVAHQLTLLSPGCRPRVAQDTRPVEALFAAVHELHAEGYRPDFYLLTNHGSFSVARLDLARVRQQVATRFRWATYFGWELGQVHAALAEAAGQPSVLVEFTPAHQSGPVDVYLNQGAPAALAAARQADPPFHLWRTITPPEGGFTLNLYRNFTAPPCVAGTASHHRVWTNFGDRILLEQVCVDARRLVLDCVCLARMTTAYKLMVHAIQRPEDGASAEATAAGLHVWDAYLRPGTQEWLPGQRYRLEVALPAAEPARSYDLELGFFDEADVAGGWPRLPCRNAPGDSSVRILDARLADVPEQ